MRIQTNTYSTVAANVTGFLSNATGATWTLTNTVITGSDLAHNVTIKGDAATDHSGKTALITGTDLEGNIQTETVALPNGTATVTSTKFFKTVVSVVPSATIGLDTMDIGWAVTAVALPFPLSWRQHPFQVSFATYPSGTSTVKVQHTYDEVLANVAPFIWYDHATFVNKATAADGNYTSPVTAIRLAVTAWTSGTVKFTIIQGNPE